MFFLKQIIVCMIAGLGAGIGTGFAGMSAASVITPILFTFLGVPVYEAIGIALASDVLASAVSSYTYKKYGNIDIKNAVLMMCIILVFTIFGSVVSRDVPNTQMSTMTTIAIFFLGLRFIIKPVNEFKESDENESASSKRNKSIIFGIAVGLICGFMGAGGGMMMLFVLTTVLGYDIKKAVGTSTFIMTFTALFGAASHFMLNGLFHITELLLCVLFTLIFSRIAAVFANKADPKLLGRIVGVSLVTIGTVVLILNLSPSVIS